jgi:hypothetical protein
MVADADAPDIADDVAALSIVEPTAFTAARNERAKELRAANDRERAALVAKLPKPSWTAWALNVLARQDPDAIESWLAAGEALEAALGAGDRDALRDAQRDERSALAATIERASAVLAGAGRKVDDQVAPKLTGSLRAAITDPATRDRLTRGVLVDDVDAGAVGFGFGFGFGSTDDAGGEVVALDEARAARAAKQAEAPAKGPAKRAAKATKATRATKATKAEPDAADRAAADAAAKARAAEEAAMATRAAALAKAEAKRVEAERSRLARELRALERQVETRTAEAEAGEAAAIAARTAADAAAAALRSSQAALAEVQAALDALPPT